MERRNFIQMLVAGGVLSAAPLAANALGNRLSAATARGVMVVGQSGLIQAAGLMAQLDQVLATAGLVTRRVTLGDAQLLDFNRVGALLDQAQGSALIGVMDDARALLFQEIATARGLNSLRSTHHRYTLQQQARHCCTADSLGRDAPLPPIAQLYADATQAPADPRGPARRQAASLVSFLIQA